MMKKKKVKQPISSVICQNILRIFLIIWSIVVLFPVVWVFYTALKSNLEFFTKPFSFPKNAIWENFSTAWFKANISKYFLNSIFVVILTLILTLLITATTSYVIAKYDMKIVKITEKFYMVAMMIPAVLLLVPQYYMANTLHMTNSLLSLSFIYAITGMPFYVFTLTAFMRGIHNSLLEAATIDGASEFTIFFKIVLPLTKPSLFVIMLLSIMGSWNEYITALTFISDEKLYTVAVGIAQMKASFEARSQYVEIFAALAISMIPVIIIYAIFQKPLQNGMASSDGIKG